jgi:hypothetical protein
VQSVAQLPFQNAILKIESKKKERETFRALFIFALRGLMGSRSKQADADGIDLSELRRKISALVAQNAVPMVQQAIDAVREEGQYQAIKYLFEMIGLYPAIEQDEPESQETLARLLLERLGLDPPPTRKSASPVRAQQESAIP